MNDKLIRVNLTISEDTLAACLSALEQIAKTLAPLVKISEGREVSQGDSCNSVSTDSGYECLKGAGHTTLHEDHAGNRWGSLGERFRDE